MDSTEAELLAAIARDPEDPASYLVLADHLQHRGAVRGELMTLQNAVEDRPGDHRIGDAALDHVRAHAAYYLGSLAKLVDDPDYLQLGWRCGFIASAVLTWNRRNDPPPARPEHVLTTLLELESARFLTRLVVEPTHELSAHFTALAIAFSPPTLRSLWIGPRDPQSALRDCELGPLGAWHRIPHLRELGIHGSGVRLHEVELPALRSATIMLHGESREIAGDLVAAVWPNLERFHLWSPTRECEAFLGRDELVVLGDLGLVNCAFADQICTSIARSPLAPQLHRLSLSRGTLTDAGVETLIANRASFPSLATIDVSETFVTAAGVARLRTLATEVVAHDLRTGPPRVLIRELHRDED